MGPGLGGQAAPKAGHSFKIVAELHGAMNALRKPENGSDESGF